MSKRVSVLESRRDHPQARTGEVGTLSAASFHPDPTIVLNDLGLLRLTWLEDGYRRWNVWRADDELRVLEERLASIAYSDPFDQKGARLCQRLPRTR